MPHTHGRRRFSGATRRGQRHGPLTTTSQTPLRKTVVPFAIVLLQGLLIAHAHAQGASGRTQSGINWAFGTMEVIQFAMFVGAMSAALLSSVWLIRERGRVANENLKLHARVGEMEGSIRQLRAFSAIRDQRVVVWEDANARPEVFGALPEGIGAPAERAGFLAFGRWLMPASAARLEQGIADLRKSATPFDLTIETAAGAALEVHGRTSGSQAFLRIVSIDGVRSELAATRLELDRCNQTGIALKALLDAAPFASWLRGDGSQLTWVNAAYRSAVGAADTKTVLDGSVELLGASTRKAIALERRDDQPFHEMATTVIGGDRHRMETFAVRSGTTEAGLAIDMTAVEQARQETAKLVESHRHTLDQLTSAVAIFDRRQRLQFANQAFVKLWDLEPSFVDQGPTHAVFLDKLRSENKLEETPLWRGWKDQVLSVYNGMEPKPESWHLPDGRTIRVISNPDPSGGITQVFENLTEKIDLESRNKTLVRLQSETLGSLVEGIAVFGADGKVRLSNPSFARLWGISESTVAVGSHISDIRKACDERLVDSPWPEFVSAVTGFDDDRSDRTGRSESVDGTFLSHMLVPLSDGQVMIAVIDETDSVNVERALKDKNDALHRADELKNNFVQHISYELRSPLTNIIGFTEMLQMPSVGRLNETQDSYVDHISASSATLLAIVNDILDLASVDAGMLGLEFAQTDAKALVSEASKSVDELLCEHSLKLSVNVAQDLPTFRADGSRISQVLVNLLTNAANFAPEGSAIRLTARHEGNDVVFTVHDRGPGIPADKVDQLFKRFEPFGSGGRRRGAGLGLTIVKAFVDLHGGTVSIDSADGRGTTVTCRFPIGGPQDQPSAAKKNNTGQRTERFDAHHTEIEK